MNAEGLSRNGAFFASFVPALGSHVGGRAHKNPGNGVSGEECVVPLLPPKHISLGVPECE